MARRSNARRVFELVGDPPLSLADVGSGWPAMGLLATEEGQVPLAVHVSIVGPHARKPYEFRFQNPGNRTPVEGANGYPLLVGLAEDGNSILVVVDGQSRVGREARFSILFNRSIITEAAAQGISTYVSGTGERIIAVRPQLFPSAFDLIRQGIDVPVGELQQAASASGFLDDFSQASAERARRAASVLVRHHAFGRRVREAYNNKCALCGLGINLVAGAHILPASAPGSPDETWNGLALCGNHHTAFDNHDIWIDPNSGAVRFSPRIRAEAEVGPSVETFVAMTQEELAPPLNAADRPRAEMFEHRYEYYGDAYDWV